MNQDKMWELYQNDKNFLNVGCKDGGRIECVAKFIPHGSKVLNIGVGQGALEDNLFKKGVDIYCLDPSSVSIDRLQSALGLGDKARVGYSQEIPFEDATFDYVVMTEVLEHLSDVVLDQTLYEVVRVLREGGTFLGSVPADEELADGLVACPECGKVFHRWGHVQSFSEDRLRAYLSVGFEQVGVHREFFVDRKSINWKGMVSGWLKQIQAKARLRGSGQNFVFVAKKATESNG